MKYLIFEENKNYVVVIELDLFYILSLHNENTNYINTYFGSKLFHIILLGFRIYTPGNYLGVINLLMSLWYKHSVLLFPF